MEGYYYYYYYYRMERLFEGGPRSDDQDCVGTIVRLT